MEIGRSQQIILGPPGCGKTTALLGLVEHHIEEEGTAPDRVAYFSFTKKAVEEARSRAVDRWGFSAQSLRYFRTLHSMVFAMTGLTKKDVMGRDNYAEIGKALGIEFGSGAIDESTGMPMGNAEGDTHLFLDSLSRSRRVPLFEQWRDCGIPDLDFRAVERTVTAVKRYKQANGLVDFTDMLERYLEGGEALDVEVAFVDEAQDLSVLQWEVLRVMLRDCPRVYIAGDDDQAIYRWSGADVSSFLSLSGQRRVLDQSWRCPQQVHRMADTISAKISQRFPKHWSPKDARGRVARVHSLEAFDLTELQGTTLLLARNTYLLSSYTEQLRKRGLPYITSYGSHSVLRSHARAIHAWERLRKGQPVSGADAKTVYDALRVGVGVKRGFKSLPNLDNSTPVDMATLRETHGLIAQDVPWFDALDGIAGKDLAYYRSVLRGGRSLVETPSIAINTIHGVKGGEADNVVINPDMAWKSYRDYERNPDDEHRVAYVAVSRAKSNLFLLSPKTKNFYRYVD